MYFMLIFLALLVLLKIYIKSSTGRDKSSTCLIGKTTIVTGANSGIGFHTALDFAKRGARVILACRNEIQAEIAKNEIIQQSDNKNIVVKHIDFSSLKSVEDFAIDLIKTEKKIHILVNNAGAAGAGKIVTEHGFDKLMQINYFGCVLLTTLLLEKLKQSAPSRIVNVTSISAFNSNLNLNHLNEFPSGEILEAERKLYGRSKLCKMLFTIALASKLKGTNVTVNCLHPGVVQTNLTRNAPETMVKLYNFFAGPFIKTAEEGAQTSIYLSVSKEVENVSGCYFTDCKQQSYFGNVTERLADEVWQKTVELLTKAGFKLQINNNSRN